MGNSAVKAALLDDDAAALEAVIAREPACLLEVDPFGWTLVHWAAYRGSNAVLRRLCKPACASQ